MRVPEILSKVEGDAYGCVGVLMSGEFDAKGDDAKLEIVSQQASFEVPLEVTDIGVKLMTAAQLKALYNEYGLKVSGTKVDSKERLREHLLKSPANEALIDGVGAMYDDELSPSLVMRGIHFGRDRFELPHRELEEIVNLSKASLRQGRRVESSKVSPTTSPRMRPKR